MNPTVRKTSLAGLLTGAFLLAAAPFALADSMCAEPDGDETPFGAAVVIIELTDNDIELQVFADAFDWNRLKVFDPNERLFFDTRARGRLVRQGGLSELVWASQPSHYVVDEDDYDEDVEDFLARWPEGCYEFEATRLDGLGPLDSEAYLSHVLAELPEVTAPEEDAIVPSDEPLLISWGAVTTQYMSDDPVEVFEYQVIVNQEAPARDQPWIDGGTRRALINLPADICDAGVCEILIPAEVLEPDATYEIEILAIETSGNASIGVLAFETEAD
jgi:hypothetical protein